MPKSLILIPDISGFTKFVNSTEISHSQHIISELLELLIKSNELGLKVAEIEGDAILFIKEASVPSLEDLISQSEKMFLQFHRHLLQYETQRICNCGACSAASGLSLKIIAHISELSFTIINNVRKPFGPGLITAHRLLKNSISEHEYLLLSESFSEKVGSVDLISESWVKFNKGSSFYEDLGEIYYYSISLSGLKKNIDRVEPMHIIPHDSEPITFEGVIEQSFDIVFEVISNLEFRMLWNKDIRELKYDKNKINRAGMKHVCVFSGSRVEIETVRKDSGDNKLIYGEKINDAPIVKEITFYYILENLMDTTKVKIEIYLNPSSFLGKVLMPFAKINAKKIAANNFQLLKNFCENSSDLVGKLNSELGS